MTHKTATKQRKVRTTLDRATYDAVVKARKSGSKPGAIAASMGLKGHVINGVLIDAGMTKSSPEHREEVSRTVQLWLRNGGAAAPRRSRKRNAA
jgi:hypothetical protein